MRFSIIIIHRNGEKRLLRLLNSIYAAIESNDEVIIIDNNSPDKSIEKVQQNKKFKDFIYILNSCNLGYGSAANKGIKISKGEFILILNNDLVFNQNFLSLFEQTFDSFPDAGMVTGQLYDLNKKIKSTAHNNPSFSSELGFSKPKKFSFKGISQIENMTGACIAVRKSMLAETGAYDEDFFFCFEETEWCMRIKKFNWKIYLNPDIQIFHEGGGSTKEVLFPARMEFLRSRKIFWRKVFPSYQYKILSITFILKLFFRIVFYLCMFIISFGLNKRFAYKLKEKVLLLIFISMGMPIKWCIPRE